MVKWEPTKAHTINNKSFTHLFHCVISTKDSTSTNCKSSRMKRSMHANFFFHSAELGPVSTGLDLFWDNLLPPDLGLSQGHAFTGLHPIDGHVTPKAPDL